MEEEDRGIEDGMGVKKSCAGAKERECGCEWVSGWVSEPMYLGTLSCHVYPANTNKQLSVFHFPFSVP